MCLWKWKMIAGTSLCSTNGDVIVENSHTDRLPCIQPCSQGSLLPCIIFSSRLCCFARAFGKLNSSLFLFMYLSFKHFFSWYNVDAAPSGYSWQPSLITRPFLKIVAKSLMSRLLTHKNRTLQFSTWFDPIYPTDVLSWLHSRSETG